VDVGWSRERPIPWLHIGKVGRREAERRGFGGSGVLGTRLTMGGPVYPEALGETRHGGDHPGLTISARGGAVWDEW
jgi:hypothetical protein